MRSVTPSQRHHLSMTFADKHPADENSDTDTDSSDGSSEDLLLKVSQENFFLPLHGSSYTVGKVLGNLCSGHRGVYYYFLILVVGMKSSGCIYVTWSLKGLIRKYKFDSI